MQSTKNKKQRKGRGDNKSTSLAGPTSEYQAKTAENRSALQLARALKGPNNKYINTVKDAISASNSINGTSPGVFLLNGVAQGTTENTRIGRLLRHRWLDIDLDIYMTTNGAADLTNMFRMYIVVETTALGSALAPAQFFSDASNFSPTSQRNRTTRNASRFVVLWDSKPFVMGTPPIAHSNTNSYATSGAGQPEERVFSLHLPLEFDSDYSRGNAGTIADIDTNSLYLLVVNDQGTSSCTLVGGYTLCFSDIQH